MTNTGLKKLSVNSLACIYDNRLLAFGLLLSTNESIAEAVEGNLFVFKTINRMIIHHADGLHKRITNRGADKVKSVFL